MADGSPVTPELDARMLADLREWRDRIEPSPGSWSMRLTIDELDMLLRRCAEVDELKRQACETWEPSRAPIEIPAGHALVKGEVVPLAWPDSMIRAHGHGPTDPRDDCPICDPSVIA